MLILGFFILITLAELILSAYFINANENAVITRFGASARIRGPGLTFAIWPIEKVVRFTTNIIELNFSLTEDPKNPRRAGIITKQDHYPAESKKEEDYYGAATIGAEVSMYFCWPEPKTGTAITEQPLAKTIKKVSDPTDIQGLIDLFEETVFDAFRVIGGGKTWREITQERKNFANEVLNALNDEDSDPIKEAALANVRLVITHLELPTELHDSIVKPEVERLKKKAAIQEGEAEKIRIQKRGEGDAYAREKLIKAIGGNIQVQSLLSLEQMAKGTSNTLIVIPTDIAAAFENIVKRGIDLTEVLKGLNLDNETIDKILKAYQAKK